LSLCLLLTGCATSTLSSVDAEKYKDATLTQFLADRFQDRQSVFHENSVRYAAYFNDVNNRQLFRPTQEIINFCRAGSGEIVRTRRFSGDPVGKYFTSPAKAAWEAAYFAVSVGRPDLALRSAQMSFEETERINARFDSEGARKAYNEAVSGVTYGAFECKYASALTRNWRVDIVPVGFLPRSPDGNLLSNHKLVIEISPYQR
jgi:hypothetical protein